jgi:hypothetical protein
MRINNTAGSKLFLFKADTMEMKEELQVKEEKIDIDTDFLANIISNEEGSLARSVSAETVLQIRIRDLGSGIRCLFDPEIRDG